MLWEIEIRPRPAEVDRDAQRVESGARAWRLNSIRHVRSARSFLLQGPLTAADVERAASSLLVDAVVETHSVHPVASGNGNGNAGHLLNVLFKPGVTDNVALSTEQALRDGGFAVEHVATCRKYWVDEAAHEDDLLTLSSKVLANDAIEHVVTGPLSMATLNVGREFQFEQQHVPIRELSDEELQQLSKSGQLYLSLAEMQTIQQHFRDLQREPTDAELETIAQTWSEHCSHKTLGGRIRYRDERGERTFTKMLKETIFAATEEIRKRLGPDDWCVSVFRDNAGVVTFDEQNHVCIKVETHNHPSALEPYGGANTGLGGVIRDPLGTGLGAKPICNTDVFCFAPPDTPHDALPPGVLHPQVVARGVVSGVRDYGNRMGIPTVNGAVYFDERYLGNPLVYCGNIALIPVGMTEKAALPGDYIVAVGGRTGRDGIHGATFSSAELTEESETLSGGAVQIGNAITEKMVVDAILTARDKGLYNAITDCGAGGFSSAVGEMGADCGAEVWLDRAPLKYQGLSYTEVWISEAQERMVLAVPPAKWEEFRAVCAAEGVEATIIGEFRDHQRLVLKYGEQVVGDLAMHFLHEGRPPVVREAVFQPVPAEPLTPAPSEMPDQAPAGQPRFNESLRRILGSLNVCSKEWIIRQYDHEVQAGSVVKPLVGAQSDGPSDAAVVRPVLTSSRGIVIGCGMNPRLGDFDPYWMAAAAIDEAVRNCVAVGADPSKIAILDNFCWGNTERPETLGSLVRAALGCYDTAIAYQTPFVSGKDSLNNEFSYVDPHGVKQTVAIPASLLITALGQIADVGRAVTMDFKAPGNVLYLVGATRDEMGGSHFAMVHQLQGGVVPRVDLAAAPLMYRAVHAAMQAGVIRSCHDLSEGGLATSLAEAAFAGEVGADIEISALAEQAGINDPAVLLFSESPTRLLMEVCAEKAVEFERLLKDVPVLRLGRTTEVQQLTVKLGEYVLIDARLTELKECWQSPLRWD